MSQNALSSLSFPFYFFLNNSVNSQPILIILDGQTGIEVKILASTWASTTRCRAFGLGLASASCKLGLENVLSNAKYPTVSDSSKDLGFDDELYPIASSLDPTYAFHWLNDHLGSQQEKGEPRQDTIAHLKYA